MKSNIKEVSFSPYLSQLEVDSRLRTWVNDMVRNNIQVVSVKPSGKQNTYMVEYI